MAEYILGWLLAGFVKPVHIQLSDKAIDISVAEELRQDDFLELFNILDQEFFAVGRPLDDGIVFFVLGNRMRTLMISKAFCTKLATEFYELSTLAI